MPNKQVITEATNGAYGAEGGGKRGQGGANGGDIVGLDGQVEDGGSYCGELGRVILAAFHVLL